MSPSLFSPGTSKEKKTLTAQTAQKEGKAEKAEDEEKEEGEREKTRRPRILKIEIKGCKQIPKRTVKGILLQEKTPWFVRKPKEKGYDPFWAEEDRRRIERFYKSKGFYSVKVEEPEVEVDEKKKGVRLTYHVKEGPPVRVERIAIIFEDGPHEEEDPQLMRSFVKFKPGDRFELEPYQEARSAMENYYKDDAFFRVEVTRRAEVDLERNTADITYRITRDGRYRIRSIRVQGCKLTDPTVVMKAINLKPGDRWRRNEIIKNQRQVQRLPIYRTVQVVEEADDEKKKIDLTFVVAEDKPREFKFGVGYGSEEGVRLQAGWWHKNFFGGARELSLFARWSELLEKETITFTQPNISRAGDFASLRAERRVEHEPAYTNEALSISPIYHFILTKYLWAEVSYMLEDNRVSRISSFVEVKEEDLAREGLLSAVGFRVDWADVDNLLNPRQGARASLYLEQAGGVLGGEFPYLKILGEARGYYPLFEPVVGALKWKLGWAEPQGDLQSLPFFKRFYAGGTGSVRGFERNQLGPLEPDGDPLGGVRLWEGSFELRFPVWREVGGVVFVDSGWVWPEGEDYDPEDVLYSTGFGIRYQTPIGPLALDIGFPLTGLPEYPDFRIHFNIGNTF